MACRYNYKGKIFNSETLLDDFLLETAPLKSVLGDIVFSSEHELLLHVQGLLATVAAQNREVNAKYAEYRALKEHVIYSEDGEETVNNPPYEGVNHYLARYKDENGKGLYPEFRDQEYWDRRFVAWRNGEYNDVEREVFGLASDYNTPITDLEELKKRKDEIVHKWEVLAKSGTAIHLVLLLCFTKEGDNYIFEKANDEIFQYVQTNLENKNRPYLNEDTIWKAIEYAKNLHEKLKQQYGEDLVYYPEFGISAKITDLGATGPTNLIGIIDLLIVDSKGKVHILDYKTSIHSYAEFGVAKELAYKYQLATYQRMLEVNGINISDGHLMVAPIQIQNFRKEGNKFIYDNIDINTPYDDLTPRLTYRRMWDEIETFLPKPFHITVNADKVGENVSQMMSKWFPDYSSDRKVTRELVIKELKNRGLDKPNENGQYVFERGWAKMTPIIATNETDFVNQVLKFRESERNMRDRYTDSIKLTLKQAMLDGMNAVTWPLGIPNETGSATWLQDTLSRYCDGNWELFEGEGAEIALKYGILILKTKNISGIAPQMDFVRISTNNLTANYRDYIKDKDKRKMYKERLSILGTYENDIREKSLQNSLILRGVYGNVEAIETMLVLNLLNIEGAPIGSINVVNVGYSNSLTASNEELLYSWNKLNNHDAVPYDNFNDGKIQFATKFEIVKLTFNHILTAADAANYENKYGKLSKDLVSCKSMLDDGVVTVDDKIRKLLDLLFKISSEKSGLKALLSKTYNDLANLQQEYVRLYNQILMAIANLKGINFRQQLEDHDKWLESAKIFTEGVSGSYMDNPGNLNSETLNLVTKLVTEAYLNTRDDLMRDRVKILALVSKLRQEKQMGSFALNTIANQTSLYSDMYEMRDGDWYFVNPNRLTGASKEFLEYVLFKINADRMPDRISLFENLQANNDLDYYRVPLSKGGSDSMASVRSLTSAFREKLKYLNPKYAWELARAKVEGIGNSDIDVESQRKKALQFEMINRFDKSLDPEYRKDALLRHGEGYFEHNLETLLYQHLFAYSSKKNIDSVFPLIKAAMIHIKSLGANLNTLFTDDVEYLDEYIRNKVLNQSIVDPKREGFVQKTNMLKKAASMFTLAFAPVQAFYQPLQGLWQDIRLLITKPDGKLSFTFNHFRKALAIAYSDLAHFSDTPTLCSALNELYGLNDMDMNVYAERLSSGKKGIWDFENFMFKFASRPDYYNRLTIFLCQMMGDGCLDAHHMENGKLVYDISKDKRFSKWWANKNGDTPEINKLRALYYQMARQFVNEHAKNPNGTPFELNMNDPLPLPRAYTNMEAEGYKSLSDDIYGYYSHEKKSLVQSTWIGSMWLQFKTYWSGKKNQYLQQGGIRLRGRWEDYEERVPVYETRNGERVQTGTKSVKFYYQVDDDGTIRFDKVPLAEDNPALKKKIAPVQQWKGQWQEGIMLTLSDAVKQCWDEKSFTKGFVNKWNVNDPDLQRAYRSNLKLLIYDLLMWAIGGSLLGAALGDWLDDLEKEAKNDSSFATGLKLAAANVAVKSITNSFIDFNMIEGIGSPINTWTPFAFEWGGRLVSNIYNVAVGDKSFMDGVLNVFSGTRQIKPLFTTIVPQDIKFLTKPWNKE